MHQTNSSEPLKFVFSPTFRFLAQYFLILVVFFFLWKYILVVRNEFFRSIAQICKFFTLNITRVVWPHVTSLLDLRYFCRHNPLLYHLKLIPGHYWSWQRIISSLVNNFVRHTFSMSKSSIKTETVLTMTDTTEPTELLAFKRQKDGYKVTVKISLCICVVLSWDELKVQQITC